MSAPRPPPPKPDEYKGKMPPRPPPDSGTSSSKPDRPAPPKPDVVAVENERHAARMPRPPEDSRNEHNDDLDALGNKRGLVSRKYHQYRRKCIECQRSSHACERALICFVAVCLLWLTSLALCQAIVNSFVRGPLVDDVIESATRSMDTTAAFKENYDACATRVTSDCELALTTRFNAEKQRIEAVQASNRRKIEDAYVRRQACNYQLNSAIAIFAYFTTNTSSSTPETLFPTNFTGVDPRCNIVDQLFKGDAGGMQVLGASTRFKQDSDKTTEGALTAFDERRSYDNEYLANKTAEYANVGNGTLGMLLNETRVFFESLNASYDAFIACTTPTNTYNGATCPTDSVLKKLDETQRLAEERYQRVVDEAEAWEARAQATIDQATTFYNSIANNDLLRAAIDVGLVFVGAPSLQAMGFNDIIAGTYPGLNLDNLLMGDVNAIFAQYEAQAQAYVKDLQTQAVLAAQQQLDLQQAQLNLHISHPLSDYDPPPVNTSAQRKEYLNSTGPFLQQMGNSLKTASATGVDNSKKFAKEVQNFTASNQSSNFLSDVDPRTFSFYVYKDITAEDLANQWNSLISTALTFDYLFRIFRTLQIIKKYWNVSAIHTPPADVRTDDMQDKGLAVDTSNPLQKIAALLAHPATTCIVMTAIGFVIMSLFVALYRPIYDNYVQGCVRFNDENGNGTLISNNAYSISYGYAASDGDKTTTLQIDRLNAKREVDCEREIEISSKIYEDQQKEWDFVFRQHRDMAYQQSALRDCVDLDAAQTTEAGAASAATDGNVTDLRDVVPGSWCMEPIPPLENGILSCQDLVCKTSRCRGPDQPTIRKDTWKASCYVEWYLHAQLLGSLMVILTFILINFSRIFTMRGFARVFWRYLTDGRFGYIGTCLRNGDLQYPSIITEEGYSMKRAIRESLAHRILIWEAKSWFIFLFGMALNIPWIVVLSVLNSTLEVSDLIEK